MIRVDFAFGAPDRLRTTCEVVRKQYLLGRRMVVYHSDTRFLNRFDQLLWGFEPEAFIPHVMAGDSLAASTPILLSNMTPIAPDDTLETWLLNLDSQCPPSTEGFGRVLEIVSLTESDRISARNRWREYQSNGYELHAHDLTQHQS